MNGSALARDPPPNPPPPAGVRPFHSATFRHVDLLGFGLLPKGWNRVAGLANPVDECDRQLGTQEHHLRGPCQDFAGDPGSPFVLSLTLSGDSPRLP